MACVVGERILTDGLVKHLLTNQETDSVIQGRTEARMQGIITGSCAQMAAGMWEYTQGHTFESDQRNEN